MQTGSANAVAARTSNSPPPAAQAAQGIGGAIRFSRAAVRSQFTGPTISSTMGANGVNQQHILPMINGWNRRIALIVSVATVTNTATVAAAADAPWNLFTQITLRDAKQTLKFQLRGYDAFVQETYGGYHPFITTNDTDGYVALTTGAGATAPTGSFVLEIPHEFSRDGLGVEPNMDSSQRFQLDLSINTKANVWTTPSDGTTTISVTPVIHYYAKPPAVDADGNANETMPPLAGSVQFWREQTIVLASGVNIVTVPLSGRYLRNVIGMFTDASDVRSNTVRPDTMRVELDNQFIFEIPRQDRAAWLWKRFGIASQTGMYPLLLGTLAPDGLQGSEWTDEYWRTSTASQLVLKFTAGAAGKLYLMLNELQFPVPLPVDM